VAQHEQLDVLDRRRATRQQDQPERLPAHITEYCSRPLHLDGLNTNHGPVGRLPLPTPGSTGLVQIGAYQRSQNATDWQLLLYPEALTQERPAV
jgi:hypothetical protein